MGYYFGNKATRDWHNIFATQYKWRTVNGKLKSDVSGKLKWEPTKTCQLGFVVELLWKWSINGTSPVLV